MTSDRKIPAKTRLRLVSDVRQHLFGRKAGSASSSLEAKSSLSLGDSLEVWLLGTSALKALRENLRGICKDQRLVEIAENTGRWHHQIHDADGRPLGYARSVRTVSRGKECWDIYSAKVSPLAGEIDRVLVRVRGGRDTKQPKPILLLLRPMRIVCLWLAKTQTDTLLVVYAPPDVAGLQVGRAYDWFAVMRRLADSSLNASLATGWADAPSVLPLSEMSRMTVSG